MGPKKDKGKSQALVISSEPKALTPPISATELANRFAPLGNEISTASYSSTLVTPFDPFADVSLKSSGYVPKPSFQKTSGYVILPFCQYLFSIELERSNVKSASNLALSYFPRGFHWIYEHPLKSLSFYSNILIQTRSVQIGPIYDKDDPSKVIFHRIKFFKVISEKEWGGHPSIEKELHGFSIKYNYYDYIEAWSKVFLYQTALMDHSWFIAFDKNFTRVLPVWFAHWWSHYGLIPDVLPLNFVGTFDLFKSCYKVDAYGSNFPIIFHFAKMFKISWILKWQYVIVGNRVERHWFCKWWDKFPHMNSIIEEVRRMAQAPKAQNVPLPSTISPKPIGNTPTKALTATSPASSSTSLSKKERKKALLQQMIALEKEEDSDEEDSASSAPIYDPQRDFFGNSGFGDDVPGLEDL
jgi:hypothetical protein